MDHIAGLTISAGATSSPFQRYIAGLESVVNDLESNVFNGKIWPPLARKSNVPGLSGAYVYNPSVVYSQI